MDGYVVARLEAEVRSIVPNDDGGIMGVDAGAAAFPGVGVARDHGGQGGEKRKRGG